MAILFSKEIRNAIMKELQYASESVQIITAYCKKDSLKYLDENIGKNVTNKRLMVRFRLDDIIKGSTDFGILEYAIQAGWKVYIRFDLHAKTYIVDNKRGFIGSANITNSGLNIGNIGNIEMGTLVDIEKQDIEKIDLLFRNAILVDDPILEKLRVQYSNVEKSDIPTKKTWGSDISSLFKPHIDALFSHELPECNTLVKGQYIAFLDEIYDDIQSLKESFRWCPAYLWLLNTLKENKGEMYFGGLAEKLHNILVNDPKPYRKDVKVLLDNLLKIVEQLGMEEVEIDVPNYSQRVRIVAKY